MLIAGEAVILSMEEAKKLADSLEILAKDAKSQRQTYVNMIQAVAFDFYKRIGDHQRALEYVDVH